MPGRAEVVAPAGRRRRLLIRADGSVELGTGHLTRCLALASEMMRRGWHVVFASRPSEGDLRDEISAAGIRTLELTVSPDDEAAALAAAAGPRGRFDAVVVDHYGLGLAWLRAIRPLTRRLVVIDDLAAEPLAADLVVSPGPDAVADRYRGLVGGATRLLLGPRYALLREEFAVAHAARRPPSPRVDRVVIAMGGSDPRDATRVAALAAREALPLASITILLGPAYRHDLGPLATAGADVQRSPDDYVGWLAAADVAVGAGGGSALERCCIGLPSIIVRLADNQAGYAAALAQQGAAVDTGPLGAETHGRIVDALRRLDSDPDTRGRMSDIGRALVDGRGAVRVGHHVDGIRLRRARREDEELLWQWANDRETRANSLATDPIPYDVHRQWFARRLDDPSTLLLLAENGRGMLGQVRFDLKAGDADVSIAVAPEHRGTVGRLVLDEAMRLFRRRHPESAVRALVKRANVPSRRLFEGSGFVAAGERDGVLVYESSVAARAAPVATGRGADER